MTDKNPIAHYSGVLSEAVQESAAANVPASGAVAQAAPLTRYCPECGHVGEIGANHRDCCPDGSHAFTVPAKWAHELRDGFLARLAQEAPAAVAVPDAVRDAETLLRAEAARLDRIYGAGKWYGFSAEKASHLEHLRVADALAATPAADAKPFLSEDDLDDLRRFEGMASDGESYDIAKKRMKRLAELGVVRWVGGSRYCMTAFGQYVLKCWDHLPLEAHEEANARVNAEFRARIDRLNAEAITAQAAAKEGAQQG